MFFFFFLLDITFAKCMINIYVSMFECMLYVCILLQTANMGDEHVFVVFFLNKILELELEPYKNR